MLFITDLFIFIDKDNFLNRCGYHFGGIVLQFILILHLDSFPLHGCKFQRNSRIFLECFAYFAKSFLLLRAFCHFQTIRRNYPKVIVLTVSRNTHRGILEHFFYTFF